MLSELSLIIFQLLCKLVQYYLNTSATSILTEMVFSDARNIYNDRHNRCTVERTEALVFIKDNFELYEVE